MCPFHGLSPCPKTFLVVHLLSSTLLLFISTYSDPPSPLSDKTMLITGGHPQGGKACLCKCFGGPKTLFSYVNLQVDDSSFWGQNHAQFFIWGHYPCAPSQVCACLKPPLSNYWKFSSSPQLLMPLSNKRLRVCYEISVNKSLLFLCYKIQLDFIMLKNTGEISMQCHSIHIVLHPQVHGMQSSELATLIEEKLEKILLIDSRSFLEYNDSHVQGSINIQSSKLIRKRLEQNKLNILDLLKDADHDKLDRVVIYDQSTSDISTIPREHFMYLIARKLGEKFHVIFYLQGKPYFPVLNQFSAYVQH